MKKILNLYAGIGGNRKSWNGVNVTAIEINPEIAEIYQKHFPNDNVIIGDAHKYLLDLINEDWDFIWSSPPCPTHSRARWWGLPTGLYPPVYPDMKLYQEIIFLKHHAKCYWVVENVKGYYDPLITPKLIGRHYIWSNFHISKIKDNGAYRKDEVGHLEKRLGFMIEGTGLLFFFIFLNSKVKLAPCLME